MKDTQPPRLISTDPAHRSVNVFRKKALMLTFDEPIYLTGAPSSFLTLLADGPNATSTQYSLNDTKHIGLHGVTLLVTHSQDFISEAMYHITLSANALRDDVGNAYPGMIQAAYTTRRASCNASLPHLCASNSGRCVASPAHCDRDSFAFHVEDYTPPVVITYSPSMYTSNVDINTTIVLTFSEPIQAALHYTGSFILEPNMGVIYPNGSSSTAAATQILYMSDKAKDVTTGASTVTVSGRTITLVPPQPLIAGRTYTVYTSGQSRNMARRSSVHTNPGAGVVFDLNGNGHMGLPQGNAPYRFKTGYPAVSAVPEECDEKLRYAHGNHNVSLEAMHEVRWTPQCPYSKDSVFDRQAPCAMPLRVHEIVFILDLCLAVVLTVCVVVICIASLYHRWLRQGSHEAGRMPRAALYAKGIGFLLCLLKFVPTIIAYFLMVDERSYHASVVDDVCTDPHTSLGFDTMHGVIDKLIGADFRVIVVDFIMMLWFLFLLWTSRAGSAS